MKKIILLAITLLLGSYSAYSQQTSVISDIFSHYTHQKVAERQKLILFDNAQAAQLEAMEYQYLLDLQKAETGCRCRAQKRTEKLNRLRDLNLQKILTREQYLKYEALDKDKIRKLPLRLTE